MLFSIIMPAYNSQATIKESIASVLNQTYQNFELIIINDNSSDATLSIITNFCHDKRILVINNENNMGVAQSRNRGLEMASGEIIAFLDSDDMTIYGTPINWKNSIIVFFPVTKLSALIMM